MLLLGDRGEQAGQTKSHLPYLFQNKQMLGNHHGGHSRYELQVKG